MAAKRRTRVEPGIYTRPDGRYEIGYRDAHGRQRWRVVEGGIAAARKQLTAAKAKRDRGDAIPANPRLTFDAAADAWLTNRVARLRPNTRVNYRNHAKHLRERFGRAKLAAITPAEIARYLAELDASGAAGRTQRGRLAVLSAVFNYAGRHLGHVGGNPCSLLDHVERPSVEDQRAHRVLTGEELRQLLDAAHDHHRLMLATAIQTGARKGEVLGLTWADVDVAARTLRIEYQLDREGKRAEPKTKRSRRAVAITPELATQLAAARLASGDPESALVFRRQDGTPYSHTAADRTLAAAIKRAGLPHVSWHDLRHAHVSLLFASGRDPVSIAARVGDSVETVLSTYAHEYDAARRREDESAALAALYDHGSFMEARGSNGGQQTASDSQSDFALVRAIGDKAQ
jgi:integrase